MIKGFKAGINKTMFITLCSLVASATLARQHKMVFS